MRTVSGSTASLLGPGASTLTADQAGNASYDPAPQVLATVSGYSRRQPRAPDARHTIAAHGGQDSRTTHGS